MNEELKRHIDLFFEKQQKVHLEYQSEKVKLRRAYRQKQSERAKNHLSKETKVGLDEKKDQAFAELKQKMKAKGADPVQRKVIERIQ